MHTANPQAPPWMRRTLKTAAVYNVSWGALVVLWPGAYFDLLGLAQPLYPLLWQCIGMLVGVFGVGYFIAAHDPGRHWPIILVGLLGKLLGPLGFLFAVWTGKLPLAFGWVIITNDLIWWLPFAAILYYAARVNQDQPGPALPDYKSVDHALAEAATLTGDTLKSLSERQPVLLVFLRHLGCIFCLETVKRLAVQKLSPVDRGVTVVLVTMSPAERAAAFLEENHLADCSIVSDPSRRLYRAFGIGRGTLAQLLGPRVWLGGVKALLRTGRLGGKLEGDGFQMPGLALIHRGRLVKTYRYQTVADQINPAEFASCPLPSAVTGEAQP